MADGFGARGSARQDSRVRLEESPLNVDVVITLATLAVTVVALASDRFSPAATVLGAVIVLYVSGVLDAAEAFQGFSNPAPITVAALYVLAGATEATGGLERLTGWALGPPSTATGRRALGRLTTLAGAASAFVPNTPLVGMLAPRVVSWARRGDVSPAPFLMPLSYAAILGGVITVLGTSTNLVVSGLLVAAGDEPLGLFEITPVGLPLAAAGVLLLTVVAKWLLPARTSPSERVRRRARQYTVEMRVPAGSPLARRTVETAGLRNLAGVYLLGIERDGSAIAPVPPEEVLLEGDYLTFVGDVSNVVDLHRVGGLVSAEDDHLSVVGDAPGARLFEVVVADGSPLAGGSLKEAGFRSRYGGAVFAVHRAGEQLHGKLGSLRLRAGDVLLVLANPGFRQAWNHSADFTVVAPLMEEPPPRRSKAPVVEAVLLAVVVTAATGLLDLTKAALLGALAVLVLRVITPADARRSLNLEVLVLIAASFGLGAALDVTGIAADAADALVTVTAALGDAGVVLGVLLATMVATELLTNNAAAVLVFPIAMAAAAQTGMDERALAVALLVGASCSFLTPIGYQTNTMVFALGGYRFGDFTRLGAPLTLLTIVLTVPLVLWAY